VRFYSDYSAPVYAIDAKRDGKGHYDPYNQVFSNYTGIIGAVRFYMGVLKGQYEGR
jgi:hypothetical protein